MNRPPTATLISHTPDPVNTIYNVWQVAKTDQAVPLCASIPDRPVQGIPGLAGTPSTTGNSSQIPSQKAKKDLFRKIIQMQIPIAEFINFIFVFENVPIFWREQLVRQRKAAYWIQSHRILPLHNFYDNDLFYTPPQIQNNPPALLEFRRAMKNISEAYNVLSALGVPLEDARSVIPMCATHRISMTIELRQLISICKARSCHIAQGTIWKPIINQMIQELQTKVDPVFSLLREPLCYQAGKYVDCKYKPINRERLSGEDPLPPCYLWMENVRPRPVAAPPDPEAYQRGREEMKAFFQLDSDGEEK